MQNHTYNEQQLIEWLEALPLDRTLVLVTGVFDLLHDEHQNFLTKAKEHGDYLLVGIEPDSRVKLLKGQNRPIWNQDRRWTELKQLKSVDFVFILPEQFNEPEERERLVALIRPSMLAVSSHTPHLDKKRALIEKYGGSVVIVHQFNPSVSTTKLINSRS